jgi:cytochrome c1
VLKGALTPMPPPPPVTDEEVMALMAYVRSLSQGN